MKLRFLERPPRKIQEYGNEALRKGGLPMGREEIERIAEIFETPLTGAYNWDYLAADRKIERLYRLGKRLNWDAEVDLSWEEAFGHDRFPIAPELSPMVGFGPYEALDAEGRLDFSWHHYAWTLSQFLHGEQGALLVASQLVSCAPTHEAKTYAASQTFDEARHVEVFSRYLRERIGLMYPVSPHLKALLDKVLTDRRWDLKFIGMQIIIEGLALAAFNTLKLLANDPLLGEIVGLVNRDESRHVAFGVLYLEEFVGTLSPPEVEERARFAYEACVVMRERLVPGQVFEHYGWDVEEARNWFLASDAMIHFQHLLFTRIVPNLGRVGLLTDQIRPLYDALGILEFENLVDDGAIDWAVLEEAS